VKTPIAHPTVDAVRAIHAEVLAAHGGSPGLRDESLLESAVAAPQATLAGNSPYADVIEIAAAYLFYLCRNRPFLNGNKRAALGACLVFLQLNGLNPAEDDPEWESLTLDVAASRIDRDQTTARLRKLVKRPVRRSKPKKSKP